MEDGGPAFPTRSVKYHYPWDGMTLRDYFAAAALNGLLSAELSCFATAARDAYTLADAMMVERNLADE